MAGSRARQRGRGGGASSRLRQQSFPAWGRGGGPRGSCPQRLPRSTRTLPKMEHAPPTRAGTLARCHRRSSRVTAPLLASPTCPPAPVPVLTGAGRARPLRHGSPGQATPTLAAPAPAHLAALGLAISRVAASHPALATSCAGAGCPVPTFSCARAVGHRGLATPWARQILRQGRPPPHPTAPALRLAEAGGPRAGTRRCRPRPRPTAPRRGSPRLAAVAPSSPRARARRDGWSSRSGSPRPAAATPYCPRAGARRGRWPQRLCPLAPRRCSPPLCRRGGSQGGEGRSWRRQRRLGRRLLALLLGEERRG